MNKKKGLNLNNNYSKERLISLLNQHPNSSDINDLGNVIGIYIYECFNEDYDLGDFLSGLEHGLSLQNGSHDNNKLPYIKISYTKS
jgi:hypothetical protein